MKRFGRCVMAAALLGSLALPSVSARRQETRPIATALDAYAKAGAARLDDALAAAGLDDSARDQLERHGRAWVDAAGGAERDRRRVIAAIFALELAHRHLPDDWTRSRRLIPWACALVRDGEPSTAERLWHLASIALAEGARDWHVLVVFQPTFSPNGTLQPNRGPGRYEHLRHAFERFPDEVEIAFAAARADVLRTPIVWRRRPRPRPSDRMVDGPARDPVLARLAPFVDHPIVGPEARLWAGLILLLEHNRPADALAQLQRASGSGDAFVGYLAHYAAGRLQEAEGDRSAAIAHYRHALARRPHTQSAVLSLSALLFARGQPDEAYALVSESLRMPDPIDPFQTYGFGTYRRFHEYLAATRRELGL